MNFVYRHKLLSLIVLLFFIAAMATIFGQHHKPDLSVKPGFLVTVHEGKDTYALLDIKNAGKGDDRLVGATVDPKDARRVEIHDKNMKPVDSVKLPGQEEVLFTGDPHLMLIDASRDIMVGEKVTITLDYRVSADEKVVFTVTQADGHNHKH